MNYEDFQDFKSSEGWICRIRRRKDLKLINMKGGFNKMSLEKCENVMYAFLDNFKASMEEHGVGEELVFNADKIALYFKRFPCTTIIAK